MIVIEVRCRYAQPSQRLFLFMLLLQLSTNFLFSLSVCLLVVFSLDAHEVIICAAHFHKVLLNSCSIAHSTTSKDLYVRHIPFQILYISFTIRSGKLNDAVYIQKALHSWNSSFITTFNYFRHPPRQSSCSLLHFYFFAVPPTSLTVSPQRMHSLGIVMAFNVSYLDKCTSLQMEA